MLEFFFFTRCRNDSFNLPRYATFHSCGISFLQHFILAAFHSCGISFLRHFILAAFHSCSIPFFQHFILAAFHSCGISFLGILFLRHFILAAFHSCGISFFRHFILVLFLSIYLLDGGGNGLWLLCKMSATLRTTGRQTKSLFFFNERERSQ